MSAGWRALSALACGTLFGLGLAIAGMPDPRKVLAFLDVAGDWDGSLLLVLGAAALIAWAGYRIVLRRAAPVLDVQFHLPSARRIDAPLLLGAALFGIGWGMAGYCPGPAIVSLAYGNRELWVFLPALVAGIVLARCWRSGRGTGARGDG